MKLLLRYMKRTDKDRNRIIIPKHIVDKYGRDFYLEIYDDDTIKLVPIKYNKEEK